MVAQILGILATIFGGIGIIFLGFLLGPLSVILGFLSGMLAFAKTSTNQAKIWSVVGLVLGLIACATSPLLVATIVSVASSAPPHTTEDTSHPKGATISPEAEKFMRDMQAY